NKSQPDRFDHNGKVRQRVCLELIKLLNLLGQECSVVHSDLLEASNKRIRAGAADCRAAVIPAKPDRSAVVYTRRYWRVGEKNAIPEQAHVCSGADYNRMPP